MSINIYPEEPCLIPIVYKSSPLAVYQKDYDDIEEIYIGLKTRIGDPDDSILAKYWKDGAGVGVETGDVLLDPANHTFTLNKEETDDLPTGTYNIVLGVKVTGLLKMLWLRVEGDQQVIVTRDGVNQ